MVVKELKFTPKVYSFKDKQVVTIFNLLHKSNKLKLPEFGDLMKWDIQTI